MDGWWAEVYCPFCHKRYPVHQPTTKCKFCNCTDLLVGADKLIKAEAKRDQSIYDAAKTRGKEQATYTRWANHEDMCSSLLDALKLIVEEWKRAGSSKAANHMEYLNRAAGHANHALEAIQTKGEVENE